VKIARHQVPVDVAHENYEHFSQRFGEVVVNAHRRAASLYDVVRKAWDVILYGSASASNPVECAKPLQLGAHAGAAFFRVLSAGSGPIEFRLGLETVKLNADSPDSSVAHSGLWVQAFRLAVLGRESESIETLCQISTDLLRRSTTRGPEFHNTFVDAVRAFWTGAKDADDMLAATLAATDPERGDVTVPDYDAHHWIPEIKLIRSLLSKTPPFQSALTEAVQLHQKYYSANERRKRESYGFLAVGPLTWAAVAYDRGIAFDIESDYLPRSLIQGTCPKN
jgi:hypothetical protein